MSKAKLKLFIKEFDKIESSYLAKELAFPLRCKVFSYMLANGLRKWYAKPKGINLVAIKLWLLICAYDREENTGTNWGTIDHGSSIMAELHVGLFYKASDEDLIEWQKTIAVHGYGDNTGCDWPAAYIESDENIEVKLLSDKDSSIIEVNKVCDSEYVFVRGSITDFQFEIMGTYTQSQIKKCPAFSHEGLRFYKIEFFISS